MFNDPIILLFWAGILVVFWFFMIRPQSKKAKEQAQFLVNIEKGTKVVTSGGLHGRVVRVEDNGQVLIEVDTNVKMRFEKTAISMELTQAAYPAEGEKKAEA